MEDKRSYYIKWVAEENRIIISGELCLQTILNYFDIIDLLMEYVKSADDFIIFDITSLAVLNSSGIAAFALLINKMRDIDKRMIIYASKNIVWQVYSLDVFLEFKSNIEIKYVTEENKNLKTA